MKTNRIYRASRTLAATLIAAIFMFTAAAPVHAVELDESGVLAPDEVEELKEFFDRYGVEEEVQRVLMLKLDQGEFWDSMTDSGSPVSTEERSTGNEVETIMTYADGSIAVTSVEASSSQSTVGGVAPMASVGGCTTTSSGRTRIKTNCMVKHSIGIYRMEYVANYRYTYRSDSVEPVVQSARIDSLDRQRVVGFVSVDYKKLTIVRKNAATGAPAIARGEADVSFDGKSGGTIFLEMFVPIGSTTLAYAKGDF